MIELCKAEFRRFARWAFGLGVLHAVVLFLVDRTLPALRDDGEIAVVAGFAYALAGAIFGFYQSASYARVNHWIALLHRPLAPWRIMAAVFGASASLLFAAVLVPLLVFTAALDLQVGRVVDVRHWTMALAGAVIALIGFGVGSYLALAPRRYGWTALVTAAVLIVTSQGTGSAALLLPLLIVVMLALLLLGAFQPDRSLPPSNPGLLTLTAGIAALSLYFLLAGAVGIAWQLGLTAIGRNPEVNVPPVGGFVEASRAQSKDLIVAALAGSAGEEASEVHSQLQGVEATRLPIAQRRLPTRGELTNTGPVSFTDSRASIKWTFSHDRSAFQGLSLRDRRPAGELRPVSEFEAPPLLLGNGNMIAGGSLYRFDPRSAALERWLQLPAGEMIVANPVAVGSDFVVLGEKALYFVDRDALEAGRAANVRVQVPLPGMVGDLQRLDMAQLTDRTLVSFFFGNDGLDGPHLSWQQVVSVSPDGGLRTLAQRPLGPDHWDGLRFRSWWLSPGLRGIAVVVEEFGSGAAWLPPRAPVHVPRGIWLLAGLLSLAAAVATAFIAVRRRLGPFETAAWAVAALVLGVPLFAAFCLIRERFRLTG